MKIYFSASSSNLNKDRELYEVIIKAIEESGGQSACNWIEDKTKLNASELFEKTIEDIKSSEVLIAEITHPSTGVGQQIAMALSWKIPVIALKRTDVKGDSRFTLGTKSPYLHIIKYTPSTLGKVLRKTFDDVNKSKYIKFNFVTTRELYDFLDTNSQAKGMSMSELLRIIVEDWRTRNS